MSIRADMIGPRRLIPTGPFGRPVFALIDESQPLTEVVGPVTTNGTINGVVPSCHRPSPPQPALVIRDELLGKSNDFRLAKAIQGHAEAMAKAGVAETMFSRAKPPVDVSTPQHEHARLVAKKHYLTEKLDAHARSMHPVNHPEVVHRTKILDQVNRNLAHLESKGISSGPEHHEDWMHHYSQLQSTDPEKSKRMHPGEINTALHAHMGALASPKAKNIRKEVAGTHRGGQDVGPHTALPSHLQDELAPAKPKPPVSDILSQLRSEPVYKAKSDDWISEKIRLLRHEGKPQDQAIAIAYSMAGRSKKDKAEKSLRLYVR